MAELLKLLQANGANKSELMQALLSQSSSSSTTSSSLDANLNVANINEGNINRNTTTGASNVGGSDTTDSSSKLNININLQHGGEIDMDNFKRDSDKPFFVDPNANCLSDVHKVLTETKETPAEKKRLLIVQVTDVATDAHMNTTLNTQANIREASERIASQMKVGGSGGGPQASPQQLPDMSKLSINPSVMWQHFLNSMVPEMTKVVEFSKALPGFSDVDLEDQVRLIKQGIFEVMVSRITLLVDHVQDTMLDPSLKMKSPRAVVRQMSPLGPFIDQFFEIAKRTNPLSLTDGEIGLFGAILIFCPDRHGLKNVSAIRSIQQLYLQALYLLMKHNHKDADDLFCSILSSIPIIRKVNDDHFRFLQNIKKKSSTEFTVSFPQLHREVFDTTLVQ